jgi:hypothetical protein
MAKEMGCKDGTEQLTLDLIGAMKEVITPSLIPATARFVNPSGKLRVQLFTVAGKAVYHGIAKTKVGIKQISTTGLPNGAHIRKITDGKGINLSSKRIVTR